MAIIQKPENLWVKGMNRLEVFKYFLPQVILLL